MVGGRQVFEWCADRTRDLEQEVRGAAADLDCFISIRLPGRLGSVYGRCSHHGPDQFGCIAIKRVCRVWTSGRAPASYKRLRHDALEREPRTLPVGENGMAVRAIEDSRAMELTGSRELDHLAV